VLAGDDVPEAPGDSGGSDDAWLDEGKSGVWSSSSLVSRSDEEAWPEGVRPSVFYR
jgi:hypothetical protein